LFFQKKALNPSFLKKKFSDGVGGRRAVGGADAVGSGHGCVPARV
jgi:hypothetical protein